MLPKEIPIRFTLRPIHLLLSPLGVLLLFGVYHLPWGAESAPAWVQAVGAVLGIAIAIAVPYQQRAHALQMQREDEFRRRKEGYEVMMTLIDHQVRLLERLKTEPYTHEGSGGQLVRAVLITDLKNHQSEIEQLSINACGFDLVAHLLQVKKIAGFCGFYAEQLADPSFFSRTPKLRALETRLRSLLAESKKSIRKIELCNDHLHDYFDKPWVDSAAPI